jgi:hypothetical protein
VTLKLEEISYGLRPDSVEPLTPKKYASIAERLPAGYRIAIARMP